MEFSRFRENKAEYDALGAEVVGISVDDSDVNQRWVQSLRLPYRLLSDITPKGKVGRLYGVWDETWELEKRATFVIDLDGVIRAVNAASLALDDKPVLDALRQLARAKRS